MKKAIIGALVGAILVFGWQAVSHMFMHHHDSANKQVPNQDQVIQTLAGIFKEDGQYLIPRPDPHASQDEMAEYDAELKGKPWAMITYHTAYKGNMAMAAFRSFTTAFLSVLILILILGKNAGTFISILFKCLGLACFVFLFVYYNNNIWWDTPWEVIRAELIDLLAAWGLCGIWLGWWLSKRREKSRY